jgi:hypothetical protein
MPLAGHLVPRALAVGVLATAILVRALLPPTLLPWLPVWSVCAALAFVGAAFAWRYRRMPETAPARCDPGFGVLLVALALLLFTLLGHDFRLTSDGVDHFVYLRSLWMDGDLDLANDYAQVSPRGTSVDPLTPLGRTGNLHPVGPALLWSPLYALADLLARLTGQVRDGDGPLYRNAAAVAGLLWGWLGLVLLYDAARRLWGRAPALLATLGLGFGSFLYWYLAWAPTMAHAPAFATCAWVVWLLGRAPTAGVPNRAGLRHAAWLGAACGLAALVRWPNALVVLLPLAVIAPRLRQRAAWPGLMREAAVFALTALVAFSPQLVVWRLLYGAFITIPQGAGFLAGAPAIGGVLFSPRHGLFAWSPLLYLGLLGLLPLGRRRPALACGALLLLAALTRLNAGTADWWGGAAFGGRRFDAVLPVLGLGLAAACAFLAEVVRRRPLTAVAALLACGITWNLLLARQYATGVWDYAGPVAFEQMGHGAVSQIDRAMGSPFALPGALWAWAAGGPRPSEYEALFMERPFARWSIRMGMDERLFLEDGWSAPRVQADVECRAVTGDSAGLIVPLHRATDMRLLLRVAQSAPFGAAPGGSSRLRVLVNQRVVGSVMVGLDWADVELPVPADVLRPGRNALRLRYLERAPDTGVCVAGAALAPPQP